MQLPTSAVTFSVTCGLVSPLHVRLVTRREEQWDYAAGKELTCKEGDGADLPEWECTLDVPLKCTFKYRYVISDGTSYINLSSIFSFIPKDPITRNDGDFGSLYHISLPAPELNQQWLHSQTILAITVGYPECYQTSPLFPRLGVQSHNEHAAYSISTSVWSGLSKLHEQTHDSHTAVSFHLPHLSSATSVQMNIRSDDSQLGRVHILTSQLNAGQGVLASPIIDPSFTLIGSLTFHYSIITPFTHTALKQCTRGSLPNRPLLVGHRGSGAEGSRTLVPGSPRSHIKENTVLSFEKAGAMGAHFVEFDVHLTADMVPVIYHDFTVAHSGVVNPIHSLSLAEFKRMGTKTIKKSRSFTSLQQYAKPQTTTTSHTPATTTATPSSVPQPIFDNFPTLREVLQQVPTNIGFNIEVKYPMKDEADLHNLRPADRNAYVDCILWDVCEFAQEREIVFSSFDPDICVLLSRKQPRYPVLFLTEMGSHMRSDPRSNSPAASIHFAKTHGLQGLVCPAFFLLQNPDVVHQIKKAEMMVATWGKDNNNPTHVDTQLAMGINGIIVDHVAHIAKHWEKARQL